MENMFITGESGFVPAGVGTIACCGVPWKWLKKGMLTSEGVIATLSGEIKWPCRGGEAWWCWLPKFGRAVGVVGVTGWTRFVFWFISSTATLYNTIVNFQMQNKILVCERYKYNSKDSTKEQHTWNFELVSYSFLSHDFSTSQAFLVASAIVVASSSSYPE